MVRRMLQHKRVGMGIMSKPHDDEMVFSQDTHVMIDSHLKYLAKRIDRVLTSDGVRFSIANMIIRGKKDPDTY